MRWRHQGVLLLVVMMVVVLFPVLSLTGLARGRLGVVVVAADEIEFRLSHHRFHHCCYLRRPRLVVGFRSPLHHQVAAPLNQSTTFVLETMFAS